MLKQIWNYIKLFIARFFESLLSTIVWAFIWLAGFSLSMLAVWGLLRFLLNENADLSAVASISAIVLTITVISGHLPKLISYLLGCDTDFKGIKNGIKIKKEFIFKFCLSVIFLAFSVLNLFHVNVGHHSINTQFTWFSETHFILSYKLFISVLLLFLAQLIFSWPDRIKQNIII